MTSTFCILLRQSAALICTPLLKLRNKEEFCLTSAASDNLLFRDCGVIQSAMRQAHALLGNRKALWVGAHILRCSGASMTNTFMRDCAINSAGDLKCAWPHPTSRLIGDGLYAWLREATAIGFICKYFS